MPASYIPGIVCYLVLVMYVHSGTWYVPGMIQGVTSRPIEKSILSFSSSCCVIHWPRVFYSSTAVRSTLEGFSGLCKCQVP